MDLITPPKQFLIVSPPEKKETQLIVLPEKGAWLQLGNIYTYAKPPFIIAPKEQTQIKQTEFGEFIESEIDIWNIPVLDLIPYPLFSFAPGFLGNIPFTRRTIMICA
jgi:hypothetical protein